MGRLDHFRSLTYAEQIERLNRASTRSKNGRTTIERFHNQVDKHGPDECWPWTGAKQGSGHGQIRPVKCCTVTAHTVAYVLAHGEIPEDLCVLHTCDNPVCVNPAHLYLGTFAQNMADKINRGRQPSTYKPRLTSDIVWTLRQRRANGERIATIARSLGMCPVKAHQAITGKTFKHVGFPAATEQEQTA